MSLGHDPSIHVIEAWLDTAQAPEDPTGVLGRVMGRLDDTPQLRGWLPALSARVPRVAARVALAGAMGTVFIAVAVGGILVAAGGFPVNHELVPLAAGPHEIRGIGPYPITITLPDGWSHPESGPTVWAAMSDRGTIGLSAADPPACVHDARWEHGVVDVSGFAAERIEIDSSGDPRDCHPNGVLDALGDPGPRGPSLFMTLWLFEINGQRFLAYADSDRALDGFPPSHQDELRALINSMQIERP